MGKKKHRYTSASNVMSSSSQHLIPCFPFITKFLKEVSTLSLPLLLLTSQTTPRCFLLPPRCNYSCQGHQTHLLSNPGDTFQNCSLLASQQQAISNPHPPLQPTFLILTSPRHLSDCSSILHTSLHKHYTLKILVQTLSPSGAIPTTPISSVTTYLIPICRSSLLVLLSLLSFSPLHPTAYWTSPLRCHTSDSMCPNWTSFSLPSNLSYSCGPELSKWYHLPPSGLRLHCFFLSPDPINNQSSCPVGSSS